MLRSEVGYSMLWLMMFVLVVVCAGSTQAAVIAFSNQVDYDAAVGNELFFLDFDGSAGTLVDGNSFSPDVTFGSPEATDPTQVVWSSDAITDAGSTSASNWVGPIDGMFATPVAAFALVFSSAGENEEISLFAEDTSLIGTVTTLNPNGFFGVLSNTPIKSFLLDNGTFPSGNADRFFVNDFRANAPEPNTALLLGIGLTALGMRRRATLID